jgi:prepilin-type N-terminal cleavage/methylation domain-containing protein
MSELNYKTMKYQTPNRMQMAIGDHLANNLKKSRSLESIQASGFTILESLVAVAVVSILIVSIAPMVALSTSARINARRIDQATQAGRSYIDAVRGGVIDTTAFPTTGANILVVKPIAASANAQSQYTFESILAPTSALLTLDSSTVRGIKVDANGNGFNTNDPQDLFIQPMRSGPSTTTELKSQGFWLAVRVYRADALVAAGGPLPPTDIRCTGKSTPFSSSSASTCPIVTMRSQILPTTNANNLSDIKLGIGSKP